MARWLLAMVLMSLAACREPVAPAQPAAPDPLRARIDACEDPLLAAADLPITIDRWQPTPLSHGCFAAVVRIDAPSYVRFRSLRIAFDGLVFHEVGFEHDPEDWAQTLVVGPAPKGPHRLTITAEVGPRPFGVYAYSAYHLRLKRDVDIELGNGNPPIVFVSFEDVGRVTTPIEERLRLRADVSTRSALTLRGLEPVPPTSDPITLHAYVIRALRQARRDRDAARVWCLFDKNIDIADLRRDSEEPSARIRELAVEAAHCM